jgi:hypothetical protein
VTAASGIGRGGARPGAGRPRKNPVPVQAEMLRALAEIRRTQQV